MQKEIFGFWFVSRIATLCTRQTDGRAGPMFNATVQRITRRLPDIARYWLGQQIVVDIDHHTIGHYWSNVANGQIPQCV